MTNTYTWATESVDVDPDSQTVLTIHWRYTVTAKSGETASANNRFDLESPVPVDGFTASDAASLVQNDFGESAMAALRKRLDGMLAQPDDPPEPVSMQLPE